MKNRTIVTALGLPLVLAALTACQPTDPTDATNSPASGTQATNTDVTCSPLFEGGNGSGITESGGTLTATVSLDCHDQVPSAPWGLSMSLFYRPNIDVGTTEFGGVNFDAYQAQYTTSAHCKPGLWYIGLAVDPTPARGPQVTITTC